MACVVATAYARTLPAVIDPRVVKHIVKLAIGSAVYMCWRGFSPQRLLRVRDQYFASHSLSFLERQALAFNLYITRTDTRTMSRYWAGSAGSRFHAHGDHRLTLELVAGDTFYRRPMLDEFSSRAAETLRPGATMIEVGCGAGATYCICESVWAGAVSDLSDSISTAT